MKKLIRWDFSRTREINKNKRVIHMQKISIKNLGPIKEFESDLSKMNLLIGEQATGKSTICKSVYFFRRIKDEIIAYLYNIATVEGFDGGNRFPGVLNRKIKDVFVQLFGVSWELDDALTMNYDYGNGRYIKLSVSGGKKYLDVRYSKILTNELRKLEEDLAGTMKQYEGMDLSFATTERSRIHKEIRNRVNGIFNDFYSTYYIPAGRQLLVLLSGQKTKIDYTDLDLVNRNFMQFNESIQTQFRGGIKKLHTYYPVSERKFNVSNISNRLIHGLKGDYQATTLGEYLVVDENHRVLINQASSGQQELLWLFNQLYVLMLREESSFVIIEEPEAHLYPSLQHKVFEFITEFTNLNNSAALVTTHSPYMLTSANVLYYAGRIAGRGNHGEALQKILHPSKYVHPDQFTAWKLNVNGAVESLVDEEYEDLRSSLIDEVSEEIDRLYTKLYYYEVEHEKQK